MAIICDRVLSQNLASLAPRRSAGSGDGGAVGERFADGDAKWREVYAIASAIYETAQNRRADSTALYAVVDACRNPLEGGLGNTAAVAFSMSEQHEHPV